MDSNDIQLIGKLSDNLCLSGGAAGADVTWGMNALLAGHQLVHWSFQGHNSYDPDNTYILSKDELLIADQYLEEANITLKRKLPYKKPWIINLLRRNWYQISYATSVYIVGNLKPYAKIYNPKNGIDLDYHISTDRTDRMGVDGGTAWASQMYLDRYRREGSDMEFNLFLFDQYKEKIYEYSPYNGFWFECIDNVPRPTGIYAAIGSRNLKPIGMEFIKAIF